MLVPPGRIDALRDAIRSLWDDPRRCAAIGARARQTVVEHFGERVAKFVYGLFLKARERGLPMKVVSVNGQPGVEVFDG